MSAFVELVGVNENTVEAWLHHGSHPSDDHLGRIANALAPDGDLAARNDLLRELRRLYWTSDIAEIVGHLRQYASLICHIIDDKIAEESRSNVLDNLATLGAYCPFAEPLLATLASRESDDEWKDDLLAAGSDWIDWTRRVLTVNLRFTRARKMLSSGKRKGVSCKTGTLATLKATRTTGAPMSCKYKGDSTKPEQSWRRPLNWIPWTLRTTSPWDR